MLRKTLTPHTPQWQSPALRGDRFSHKARRPEGLIAANILNVLLQSYEIQIHMIG
jgi:hypothetical protein